MKYENLSKLLKGTSVSNALEKFDYFHAIITFNELQQPDVEVLTNQKGVFRTNCVDCLDRTNVVQTVFSRQILHKMLHKLRICDGPSGEPFQEFNPVFETIYKVLWADHGDTLSLAYSGTGALKSDFTRTGKRTKQGAIRDGINTCQRFYINNFCDGYNQDCHDYFLGEIYPQKENVKQHSTSGVKALVPGSLLLIFSIYYFLIGYALPEEYEDNLKKLSLRVLIFLGIAFMTIRTVFNTMKKNIINHSTRDHS